MSPAKACSNIAVMCLGSNPGSTNYYLCELRPQYPHFQISIEMFTYFKRQFWRSTEVMLINSLGQ